MKNKDICRKCTINLNVSENFFDANWNAGMVFCTTRKYQDDYQELEGLEIQDVDELPNKDTCKYYMEHIVSNENI